MEMRDCKLFKALTELPFHKIAAPVRELIVQGRDVRIRDDSGRTFLHVAATRAEIFNEPRALPCVYGLCLAGVDVNAQDVDGDTALHVTARHGGSVWRVVTALIRFGADVTIKNKNSETVEHLLKSAGDRSARALDAFNLFSPGLQKLLQSEVAIDESKIELLLKSWSRTKIYHDGELVKLSKYAEMHGANITALVEKYEATNEYCLFTLAGQTTAMSKIFSGSKSSPRGGYFVYGDCVDVDAKDHLYQFRWPDCPVVPQPLLAAAVEQENADVINLLLSHGVDTAVLYKNKENQDPLPLFIHLMSRSPKLNNTKILLSILKASDLSRSNRKGQNVIFEAMRRGLSCDFVKSLLYMGISLASRDHLGCTARDYATSRELSEYVSVFDNYVIELTQDKNIEKLEELSVKGYDHINDVINSESTTCDKIRSKFEDDRFYKEVGLFVKSIPKIQRQCAKILMAADAGDVVAINRLHNVHRAQNNCGHNVLHRALLLDDSVENMEFCDSLISRFPDLINLPDNMGRTPLHFAYLLKEDRHPAADLLVRNGASQTAVDVLGYVPADYSPAKMTAPARTQHQQWVKQHEAEIYLYQTHFSEHLGHAIKVGALEGVRHLIEDAGQRVDLAQYSIYLFDCVDHGHPDIAIYLIQSGFDPDVWKEYEDADAENTSSDGQQSQQTTISLRERALQADLSTLVEFIDSQQQQKQQTTNGQIQYTAFEEMTTFSGSH